MTCFRYLLSINVSDNSGAAWLSCFNETAELILGHKAEELNQLRENDNTQAYQAAFQDANFADYVFKIRVKQEHYNVSSQLSLHDIPFIHVIMFFRMK